MSNKRSLVYVPTGGNLVFYKTTLARMNPWLTGANIGATSVSLPSPEKTSTMLMPPLPEGGARASINPLQPRPAAAGSASLKNII